MASMITGRRLQGVAAEVAQCLERHVDKTKNGAINPQIEGARLLALVLENMRNIYNLNSPMTSSIATAIRDVEMTFHNFSTLDNPCKEAGQVAKRLINDLPVGWGQPLLREVEPDYLAVRDPSHNVVLRFQGYFSKAEDVRFRPMLKLDGRSEAGIIPNYAPVEVSQYCLTFRISPPPAAADKCTYFSATLEVPYEAGYLRSDRRVFTYKILLGVLPEGPGKVWAAYAKCGAKSSQCSLTVTPVYHCWAMQTFTITPSPGRKIVLTTVKVVYERKAIQERHHLSFAAIDPERVIIAAHNESFHVEFYECPDFFVQEVHTVSVQPTLTWGKTLRILKNGSSVGLYKIVFEGHDGSSTMFLPHTQTDHPQVSLVETGDSIGFTAKMPPRSDG